MYALMFDNILVAPYDEATKTFTLVEGIPDSFVPKELFPESKTVSIYEVDLWSMDRVPPPEKVGTKKMWKSLGLKHYHALDIAKKTRSSRMGDGWWLALDPTDTFRENTKRGRARFPLWNPVTFTLL